MTARESILVVEDERQIREFIVSALTGVGFSVSEASTVAHAASLSATHPPSLILLDLGLPDRSGIDFIRDYRAWSATPILVLSARAEERDKVDALDAGADDYLTKPFGIAELRARIRALLRRHPLTQATASATLRFGDHVIDCVNRIVRRNGLPIHLSQIEYRLLAFLAANPGRVLTHRQLLTQVWGSRALESHQYLRVYVGHLRQKIEASPAQPKHILTEIGIGYRFEP
ncbi:MAG: response regulator [Zoogloeaceae bacterium]|nr:response regulator [Zoogloeaceae bacterium]